MPNPRALTCMDEGSVGPALAEGTSSVEPASARMGAAAAKSEALVPWAKGEAKRKVDTPLQGSPNEGKHHSGCEALRQGKQELDAPPQKVRENPSCCHQRVSAKAA